MAHLFHAARFFEKMGRSFDDGEFFGVVQPFQGCPVQFQDFFISAADDEQYRTMDIRELFHGQIDPASTTNNGSDFRNPCGCPECGCSTRTGTEKRNAASFGNILLFKPSGDVLQSIGQALNIEAVFIVSVFNGGQQVK
jgi:hypothetical protein